MVIGYFLFMHLEKLEVQGFKSFAGKSALAFPGLISKDRRGLTAIVGPNGSGKSNIADAIKWVLGEQSMKTLRGKKSEDVIFSGSEKMGKLGMAEVSLYLNNEDKQAPIDYSQIVLTRRMYRDGNSEYLLNNSRIRLLDVQMLLAKANFGQKTYSVVGQGTVDNFLNSSLTERKEFFDEATGVKQFQIKRDTSLNKLMLSLENLAQAQMLLTEIEPRLKSLTKQVNKLQKKNEIETELKGLQLTYYGKIWHEIKDNFNETNKNFLETEKIKMDKDKKLEALRRELEQMENQNIASQEFVEWQKELAQLQNKKDQVTKEQAKLDAQLEIKLETSGQFDLSWLASRKNSLEKELVSLKEELAGLEKNIREEKSAQDRLNGEKNDLNKKFNELNAALLASTKNISSEEAKKLNRDLKNLLAKIERAEKQEDINKIKDLIREVNSDLQNILSATEGIGAKENLEKIQHDIFEITNKKEELGLKANEAAIRISSLSERERLLTEKRNGLENELRDIEHKLKTYKNQISSKEASQEQEKIKYALQEVDSQIEKVREKIAGYSEKEKEKRERLFELQKKMQILQNELNQLTGILNEFKVTAARHETRLEDLEAEIRNEYGSLREIEQNRITGHIEIEEIQRKIHSLKKHLESIGGLDPEIEKEYIQTKERFDFLSGQVEDLNATIASLEKIIKELDATIKTKFDKEFKVISQKFEEYFKILFNGGQAKILKVMAEEINEEAAENKNQETPQPQDEGLSERELLTKSIHKKLKQLQKYNATGLAGVEIQATPPGKKVMTISLLSGGERALTAIALICAIISANPSPFVVLDEVDAALDEANSERLAKILDDLSHKTQFIVITHNRASMRRADVLYGVTMQDDGVSKLLSVKLEDVKARNEI